jgi:16S rRNA (guanine966-N2)-methyltransferase
MTLKIIGGKFKGRSLKTPPSSSTRPTQGVLREAVFNICQNQIEGAHFLDIYAGSGAVGFEAISRGAEKITFIEKNRKAALCIQENATSLDVKSQVKIISFDALSALKTLKEAFDIVYIDPPYETSTVQCIEILLTNNLLKESAIVFVEERSTHSVPPQFSNLLLKNSRRFGEALLHQYNKKP